MHNLPEPILGEIPAFTIATPDLDSSLEFYLKLGFRELYRADWPFPWIMVTDDAIQIMLRKDKDPYIAMTYYAKDIDSVVNILNKKNIVFSFKPKESDMVKRYIFQSPEAINISIVSIQEGFTRPSGNTMLTMQQSDFFKPEKYTNKTIGMFGEFAIPVKNLEASIPFWENIGFKAISKFTSPYPWAILSDGLHITGLHQTDSFSNPALTFFAADMKKKIERLKSTGIAEFDEKDTSGMTLSSPEEQRINLFKLGM